MYPKNIAYMSINVSEWPKYKKNLRTFLKAQRKIRHFYRKCVITRELDPFPINGGHREMWK